MQFIDKHQQQRIRSMQNVVMKQKKDLILMENLERKVNLCKFRKNHHLMHKVNNNIREDIKRNFKRKLMLIQNQQEL